MKLGATNGKCIWFSDTFLNVKYAVVHIFAL
jgi:hypothetical protein